MKKHILLGFSRNGDHMIGYRTDPAPTGGSSVGGAECDRLVLVIWQLSLPDATLCAVHEEMIGSIRVNSEDSSCQIYVHEGLCKEFIVQVCCRAENECKVGVTVSFDNCDSQLRQLHSVQLSYVAGLAQHEASGPLQSAMPSMALHSAAATVYTRALPAHLTTHTAS